MLPTLPCKTRTPKWIALPLILGALVLQNASAQDASPNKSGYTVIDIDPGQHQSQFYLNSPVVLDGEPRFSCGLRLDHEPHPGHYFRTPKPALKKSQSATIVVNYIETAANEWTTGDGPAAKAAVERAVAQWGSTLTTSQTIKVDANFAVLGAGVLGSAGACALHALSGGSVPSPTPVGSGGFIVYGTALADKLTGTDQNPTGCDISMTFSSAFSSWNYGPQAPTGSEYDFESVVFHELGHGLDFFGSMTYGTSCGGASDEACQTYGLTSGPNNYQTVEIWNYFVEDNASNELWDFTIYPDSSVALGDAVTDSTAGLFWNGASGKAENGNAPAKIYTPDNYSPGSSFSHLDDGTFDGGIDALMTHAIANGEMRRAPGPVTCGIMQDQGWGLGGVAGDCPYAPLPVEMIDFIATVDDADIVVSWKTLTEGDNAGFELEHRYGDATFETVAFVQGQGYSRKEVGYAYRLEDLNPGKHVFRLNQLDVDGTGVYGPEIEAVITIANDFYLRPAFPNPFVDQTTIQFAAGSSQAMVLELYDGQGRLVRTLFDSVVNANEQYEAEVDASGLANGVYTIRMAGERTISTQRVVLMK